MEKHIQRKRRIKRIRGKVRGTAKRPRLCVYKSNKFTYASIIDDEKGKTIASIKSDKKGVDSATALGEAIAKAAAKAKISTAVFDRRGYKYHGRIKAVADGARKGGLKF